MVKWQAREMGQVQNVLIQPGEAQSFEHVLSLRIMFRGA
jgi:hypothetical protein